MSSSTAKPWVLIKGFHSVHIQRHKCLCTFLTTAVMLVLGWFRKLLLFDFLAREILWFLDLFKL